MCYSWHVYMAWVLNHCSMISCDRYSLLIRDEWYTVWVVPRLMLPSDSLWASFHLRSHVRGAAFLQTVQRCNRPVCLQLGFFFFKGTRILLLRGCVLYYPIMFQNRSNNGEWKCRVFKHLRGLDIRFMSAFKDLLHWILCVWFGLIYSVLMSQRHAGH